MSPSAVVALGAMVAGAVLVGWGVVAAVADRRRAAATAYLRAGDPPDPVGLDAFASRLAEPFRRRVVRPVADRLVAVALRVTPAEHRAEIDHQLAAAGLEGRRQATDVMATEALGAGVGLAAGVVLLATGALSPVVGVACAATLVLVGFATPRAVLGRRVTARAEAIRADLPDCLDLLAISVEAGIGLEGAMAVVSERMRSPVADELTRTLQEMGLGLSRHDALTNLRDRSPVPELTRFVQALIQADQLGMPLAEVLRVQADELRARRRQWARERSAKLPVKILFPLVACIFPAVLVVILGPAIAEIGRAL